MEILCPIKGPLPAPTCPPDELAPLLELLRENRPVREPTALPRGTLLPDGRLDLCKQGLGVEGCRAVADALKGNTVVRSLLLGTNGIGDEGAKAVADLLATNRTLEVAYLGCNGIGAEGAARLGSIPSIDGLWLKRNPIGAGGLRAVADLVRRGGVRVLDLVNACPGADWSVIAEAIPGSRVERLYLGGNGLDPEAGPMLARLVAQSPNLRGLYLNAGHLGDEGAIRLAEGLAMNRHLEELGLASNGIGPRGIGALVRALRGHQRLTSLDLGRCPSARALGCPDNRIGEAAEALAWFLESQRLAGLVPEERPEVDLIRSVYR